LGLVAMKPRLQVADHTDEDLTAWYFLRSRIWRYRPGYSIMRRIPRQGDRRDAELMYRIEICRQYEREHPEKFIQYQGWAWVHAMVQAALQDGRVIFTGSDITYYA
jgi:hypothetical protein